MNPTALDSGIRDQREETVTRKTKFVAINFIECREDYRERFESLFGTRLHAIDRMPGFLDMYVLRLKGEGLRYLILSHWETEAAFAAWTKSPEFLDGHRRGFEDLRRAKERGEEPPMTSDFKVYEVIAP